MKVRYMDLMEKALSAYSTEHILQYFEKVKEKGLTEHGFPRLTANMGILIAHGRREDLLPVFLEMMEFCCKTIPTVKAANDFSVREIVCCLLEAERSAIADRETTDRWRGYLATIEPTACYTRFAKSLTDEDRNWALFTGVSEYFRKDAGIGDSGEFMELQFAQQLQFMDENGMYRDNKEGLNHNPMVYDLVPRGLYCLLLDRGYRGRHYEAIDRMLKKAGLLTLDMQSTTGELAFGGRSNQFMHNEAWIAAVMEFEAKRYAAEGELALAGRFKAGVERAVANIAYWLNRYPIRHIKNRYPTETGYGCEQYAYFDKYMITVASFLYAAYLICDDTVAATEPDENRVSAAQTSAHFHKLILKSGAYCAQWDYDADPHYDAGGLGRVHRSGAPSAICMSCPCPAEPKYKTDIPPVALSLCSAVKEKDIWILGAADGKYEVVRAGEETDSASAVLRCRFPDGKTVQEHYRVSNSGVSVCVQCSGEIGFALPAFAFDGEKFPKISCTGSELRVIYEGWCCCYTTDGTIIDLNQTAPNRNGHYRTFMAAGRDTLCVRIRIDRE